MESWLFWAAQWSYRRIIAPIIQGKWGAEFISRNDKP